MRLLVLLLLLGACAAPGAGRFLPDGREVEPGTFLTAAGLPITADHLAAAAMDARYVLVGEGHDSACDHLAQAAIVRSLAGRAPVVGLEMVSTERQPTLDRFSAGDIALDEVGEALAWQASWGVPFALYEPIFAAAAEAGLPIAALNLPASIVRQVSRDGSAALPPEVPEILPAPPEQEAMLRDAFQAHAHGDGSDAAFERFVRVQSLWDTAMARNAHAWSRKEDRPVIVLAGAGHVTNGWGIGHRLRQLDPDAGVLEIMPWRGEAPPVPAEADLFFYCPREGRGSR